MGYSLVDAIRKWIADNPGFSATSALETLNDLPGEHRVDDVHINGTPSYTGIKGGTKRVRGSGELAVELADKSDGDPFNDTWKMGFPFTFDFTLDQDGNIIGVENLEVDISSFYDE